MIQSVDLTILDWLMGILFMARSENTYCKEWQIKMEGYIMNQIRTWQMQKPVLYLLQLATLAFIEYHVQTTEVLAIGLGMKLTQRMGGPMCQTEQLIFA